MKRRKILCSVFWLCTCLCSISSADKQMDTRHFLLRRIVLDAVQLSCNDKELTDWGQHYMLMRKEKIRLGASFSIEERDAIFERLGHYNLTTFFLGERFARLVNQNFFDMFEFYIPKASRKMLTAKIAKRLQDRRTRGKAFIAPSNISNIEVVSERTGSMVLSFSLTIPRIVEKSTFIVFVERPIGKEEVYVVNRLVIPRRSKDGLCEKGFAVFDRRSREKALQELRVRGVERSYESLHRAVESGDSRTVSLLLDSGVLPFSPRRKSAANSTGESIVGLALREGSDIDVLQALLQAGATPAGVNVPKDIDEQTLRVLKCWGLEEAWE